MSWLTHQQQELELHQAESRTVVPKLPSFSGFGDMSGFVCPVLSFLVRCRPEPQYHPHARKTEFFSKNYYGGESCRHSAAREVHSGRLL